MLHVPTVSRNKKNNSQMVSYVFRWKQFYSRYICGLHAVKLEQVMHFTLLYIYMYAFSRRFYPKRLKVHSGCIFLSVRVFSGNRTHNFCAANAMLYPWATRTLCFIQNFTAFFHHRETHLTHNTQTVVVVYQFKGGSCIFMNLAEGNFVYIDFYHGQTEFYSFSSLFQFIVDWLLTLKNATYLN